MRASALLKALAVLAATGAWVGCIDKPSFTTLEDAADGGVGTTEDGAVVTTDDAATTDDTTAPPDDATPATDPQSLCLAACPNPGTCYGGTCTFSCTPSAPCPAPIACPPGIPCQVDCNGDHTCKSVDCTTASTCKVTCTGDAACMSVDSTSPSTTIVCSGKNACTKPTCHGDTCAIQCSLDACKIQDSQCCATKCTFDGFPGQCK